MGCIVLGKEASNVFLQELTSDKDVSIRIAAAEALYYWGDKNPALSTLTGFKSQISMAKGTSIECSGKEGRCCCPCLWCC